ncbi:MAG: hypothetical protein A2070_02910 [Bdellovibrionales bacterium GWC1_52_8]|nr:MAG: hypothetical protein A2Z97_08505 [Bdellovibrionales bacterium GWB1_52_6]OFZ02398.1 MAG: hypothetical protein A2X97_12675 [Bdellovibrionales bacterium GWA1_52_35]OFZ34329.1 MAG: hypothetical protein A2070_02910 [Bdellovibrionales bacterium GWC1_52_8]
MQFTEKQVGDAMVISPQGRLDATTSPGFERAVLEKAASVQPHLVFDLSGIEYLSSAGLRVFALVQKKWSAAGKRVVLCAPQPQVLKVFDLAGFTGFFQFAGSVQEGLGGE